MGEREHTSAEYQSRVGTLARYERSVHEMGRIRHIHLTRGRAAREDRACLTKEHYGRTTGEEIQSRWFSKPSHIAIASWKPGANTSAWTRLFATAKPASAARASWSPLSSTTWPHTSLEKKFSAATRPSPQRTSTLLCLTRLS
jgi:hypothetical protein